MANLAGRAGAAIARAAARIQRRTKEQPATLCNVNGDITPGLDASVPGAPAYVYALMPTGGAPAKVYNGGRVKPTTGARVWVGYEPRNKALLRVLDFNFSWPVPGDTGGIGPHHKTHEFLNPGGGNDPVYSEARQLMPLRVSPAGALTVKVESSPMAVTGGWDTSPATVLDLASLQPAIGSLYALVVLDATGVLAARAGTAVGPFATLTDADIPATAVGERALAAVALYAGQTAIQETTAVRDVRDLRFSQAGTGGASSGLPWANVKNYGALGDAATSDDTAFAAALAVLNAATPGGTLYVPPGDYVTAGGFTISKNITVRGDGAADNYGANAISQIRCTSATAILFAVSALRASFRGVALKNTYSGTPSAGAGVSVTGSDIAQKVDLLDCSVYGFYDCVRQNGMQWLMHNVVIAAPVRYGVLVQNTVNPDGGDWVIDSNWFSADLRDSTAGVRVNSGGGGKITNCKWYDGFVVGGHKFTNSIDVTPTGSTVILLIDNCSMEYYANNGVYVNIGTPTWDTIVINGCEFASYFSGCHAIQMVSTTAGHLTTVTIGDNALRASPALGGSAIDLTKVNHVTIGNNSWEASGYASLLTQSGCTDVVVLGLGGATVSSVALTAPAEFAVGGSPVTTAGTLALSWATETANKVLAGPASGAAAAPTFRALADADLPTVGTPGTYTNATVTTDAQGRVSAASSGASSSGGTGQAEALTRWTGDGAITAFLLPDVAETVLAISDAGLVVDPLIYTLGADGFTLTFDTAPTAAHVLTALYILAQL